MPNLVLLAYLPVVILGFLALIFWIVALILFIRTRSLSASGVRVQGRVVRFDDYRGRGGRLMYSAVYEATVPDGRTLQCKSGIATSYQSPPIGTVAPLLFRPQDSSKPLITLGFSRYIMTTVFAGVALIVTIPAITVGATVGSVSGNLSNANQQLGEAFSAVASVSAMEATMNLTPVTNGNIHSVGGELGTFDTALNDCQSGEHENFYGADFYAPGSDKLALRYVHDEAAGDIFKVAIPSKPGTVTVLDKEAKCTVREGTITRTKHNVTTSRASGNIKYIDGHVKFDCAQFGPGKGRVSGEVTFANCH